MKGLTKSAGARGTTAFDGVLAKAVAAKDAKSARTAVRIPVPETGAKDRKTDAARAKAAGRDASRSGQRRADEAPGVERTAAEHAIGRTASAALPPTVGAALPADPRTAGQVGAAQRTEPRVQVVDLRKKSAAADVPESARSEPKTRTEKTDGSAPAAKPFAERLAAAETNGKAAAPPRATPLERIREMTGSDLVRTAGLVVRDGGGEIRLTLKPENLGSVRIRLSVEDGKVEGRIIVDTPEARQAFEAGLDSLTRALAADGFRTGSLQVSVSGGNANDSRQAAGLLGDTITGARLRASDEALQAAVLPAGWTGGGDGLVNVFA